MYSPHYSHHPTNISGSPTTHHITALQQTVRRLRQQNLELVEKVQRGHSHQHTLQLAVHEHRINEDKLKSRIQALELERSALLATVSTLKSLLPEKELEKLPQLLQKQTLSSSPSLPRRTTVATASHRREFHAPSDHSTGCAKVSQREVISHIDSKDVTLNTESRIPKGDCSINLGSSSTVKDSAPVNVS